MEDKWSSAIKKIIGQNVLFFYKTPIWRDRVYELACGRKRSNQWRKWHLSLTKASIDLFCVPETIDTALGLKGDVLVFEEGTPREWIDWAIAETRWYNNGKNYILTFDGELAEVPVERSESEVSA